MTYTFPKKFMWGTATAVPQVESNNTNSDTWVLEHVPGTIFVELSGDAIAKTGLPVIVTENGIGIDDDTRRALNGVANCLRDGLDVRGYTYWSAFDNFEWMLGYRPTFGLIGVDRTTQARMVKPSAHWLSAIARANAV